ncbi:MAG: hypothetical protein M1492_03490 [Gammaproteobacteria bacterium]|jgi:hypothetical protein|nr:hypothetical protein [Gammaproteobacteria bacterium]
MNLIEAPWTAEQVETLNRLQRGEIFGHPYTCPNRTIMPHHNSGHDTGCLLATKDGWVCLDCGYTQDWAYALSLEGVSLMNRMLSHRQEGARK